MKACLGEIFTKLESNLQLEKHYFSTRHSRQSNLQTYSPTLQSPSDGPSQRGPSPGVSPKSSVLPSEDIIEGSAGQGREATHIKSSHLSRQPADSASCAPAFSHANYSVHPAACLLRRPALLGSQRPQRKGVDSQPSQLHS